MLENIAFFQTKREKNHRMINIESGERGELASCSNPFVLDCRKKIMKFMKQQEDKVSSIKGIAVTQLFSQPRSRISLASGGGTKRDPGT